MNFTRIVSSVFYTNISDGLILFVECLQFTIKHKELNISQPYCVLEKDGIRIMVFQDQPFGGGTLSRVEAGDQKY